MSNFEKRLAENKPNETNTTEAKDKLKNYQKTIEKTTSKTIKVWVYFIPQIFMTLLALFIIGAYQFVEANFDPAIFATAQFWGNYLSYQSASWILILNIIATSYKVLKKKHTRYATLRDKRDYYVTIDETKPFISKGAENENRQRKIKAYKIWVNQKIHKILNKHKISDLEHFLLENNYSIETNKEKRLKKKLDYLLSVLTDEYINKNIDNVKCGWKTFTYATVSRDKLVSGARSIETNHGENDFKEHNVMIFTKFYLSGFLFISVLMFILLSFSLDPKQSTLDAWITFAIKMFMIGFSAINTWLKTDETFELTKLKVIEETTSEIGKYYSNTFTLEERIKMEQEFKENRERAF